MSILLLNGPNLNLLGTREPHIYGATTLAQIEDELTQIAANAGAKLQTLQSNHEGVLIDRIHAARTDGTTFIIINPGGLTHTSVAHATHWPGSPCPLSNCTSATCTSAKNSDTTLICRPSPWV